MLEILNLHKRSLATLLLASMAMLMLAGCSSSDEAAQEDCAGGGPRGDEGVCCDLDQIQPGCPAM
jgi:hypothetical protein